MQNLDAYMASISKLPLLSPEEEYALLKEYSETKSVALRNKIVDRNLRLVVKFAFKYKTTARWDLIQEGNIGLIYAVEKFDLERNVKFSFYASYWIKAKMLSFLMVKTRSIKITSKVVQLYYKISEARKRLLALGAEPEPEAIALSLGLTPDEVINYLALFLPPEELDNEMSGGNSNYDIVESTDYEAKLLAVINSFSEGLDDNQREILDRRIVQCDPDTFEAIGTDLDLTRQRVQQIEKKIRMQLQKRLNNGIK